MEKEWGLYILQCGDGTLYTGITDNFEKRFKAHCAGKGAKYTRGRGPLRMCYQELCKDHGAALRREAQIKKMSRIDKLKLIESYGSSKEADGEGSIETNKNSSQK